MRAVSEVTAFVCAQEGRASWKLRIAVLPSKGNRESDTLWRSNNENDELSDDISIEVLEGNEYRYEWLGGDTTYQCVSADPEEIFQPDTDNGRTGRLRPQLSTGTVHVVLRAGEQVIGKLDIEVRSRKLAYKSEYRWMLRDIAEKMTELVMDRFAASVTRFELDQTRDAVTLYQRFSFLRALFESDTFQSALNHLLRHPHLAWESTSERVRPGAGIRADSHLVRQMSQSGPRLEWHNGRFPTLPMALERRHTGATHDTTPNRFVKYALEHWCQVLGDIDRGLASADLTPATQRGRREVAAVVTQLEDFLHRELFIGLGPIKRFPADDQVLQKREGYRDVYKAYLEFELAAQLSWLNSSDTYGAGLRDVATLYEYWAFIQLAKIVGGLVGVSFDVSPLVETRRDGMNVVLQSGIETVLKGEVIRFGRRMFVELCFNRTYGVGRKRIGSWTKPMRPDYSLLIHPADGEVAAFEPVVLHFDAKYRVEYIEELFGSPIEKSQDSEDEGSVTEGLRRGGALRVDLLKMHAYRDAIRRTAGAYVLYPGGDQELNRRPFTEYHELLPGLGAFVLRPTDSGRASGADTLLKFLGDVLDHIARRLTQHERGRHWQEEIYGKPVRGIAVFPPVEPAPETSVILGFVKSQEHWAWIEKRKTYNVRTEGRVGGVSASAGLLQSQLLVLYCPSSNRVALARIVSVAERVSKESMQAAGYPDPQGDYWCVQLNLIGSHDWLIGLSTAVLDEYVQRAGQARGEPALIAWSTLQSICDSKESTH